MGAVAAARRGTGRSHGSVEHYDRWLAGSHGVPKLLLTFGSSPTLLIGPEMAAWCAAHIAGLETRHCGAAGHHAPEDQPAVIAAAVSDWVRRRLGSSDIPRSA